MGVHGFPAIPPSMRACTAHVHVHGHRTLQQHTQQIACDGEGQPGGLVRMMGAYRSPATPLGMIVAMVNELASKRSCLRLACWN